MATATFPHPKAQYAIPTATNAPLTLALQRLAARTPEERARNIEAARRQIAPGRPYATFLSGGKVVYRAA